MDAFKRILAEHAFFKDLPPQFLELVQGCASNVRFEAGEFIYREGADADQFYLIRTGRVSLEMFVIGRGTVMIETLSGGDLLGWSWLMPPYKEHFDARALEPVHAIALDGKCLRTKCDQDHDLGYGIMQRFANIIIRGMQATRLQFIDAYGTHS